MTSDPFWRKVNEVLDQRKDPFLDPEVQAHLLEHPEALEEAADLRYRLRLMEKVPPRPERKPWMPLLFAAAASVAALLFWIHPDPPPEVKAESTNIILKFELSITFKGPEEEGEHLLTRKGWTSRWRSVAEDPEKESSNVAYLERERRGTF